MPKSDDTEYAATISQSGSTMQVYLGRALPERTYLLVVALAAVMVSISMTIPFASILIGAVLLRHERWKEIVAVSSLGSATGGLILYSIFYYLGWAQIVVAYPDLIGSKAWSDATGWISAYGAWALLGVAAMPLPQTPALILTAMLPLPAFEVFLALLTGKLLKYGIYGWLAANFPSLMQHYARELPHRLRVAAQNKSLQTGALRDIIGRAKQTRSIASFDLG